ncbi:TolC family protein [Pseudorhodobacter ferrugineus]|uniref:TolC family protein n=1 Tax=Pseudorhodobacter ferrugineus TaxID=77008 RepID=UPI0003B5054E|nr:TolC family protein [Pseudorhodobacter ferrugineus]
MPFILGKTARGGAKRSAAAAGACAVIALLSGCMDNNGPGVSMFGGTNPSDPAAMGADTNEMSLAASDQAERGENRSAIIDDLIARRSVIPANGPYAQVATGVLSANKGAAAAELRVARLKAEAKSKNWLPSIGPSISLTSLGTLAASILVEQVLFDNGKRGAERAFAAADVEIAAVGLSDEMNTRVYEGLSYYITAQRAQAQAAVATRGLTRMQDYGRIMGLRVSGGLSDRSEERVIQAKIAEMQSAGTADMETATTAMAELNAMMQVPISGLSGLSSLNPHTGPSEPLTVLRSSGEGRRSVAEAKMARAGFLPTLSASGNLGKGGMTGGLNINTENGIGFGTGASLRAIKASTQAATQRTESARDDAQRKLVAIERDIATLKAREVQGATVLAQTEANLDMFTQQYKFGRRPLMELVGMFETFAAMERENVALKYDIALLNLQIAKIRGVLVDGVKM